MDDKCCCATIIRNKKKLKKKEEWLFSRTACCLDGQDFRVFGRLVFDHADGRVGRGAFTWRRLQIQFGVDDRSFLSIDGSSQVPRGE